MQEGAWVDEGDLQLGKEKRKKGEGIKRKKGK